MKFMNVKNNSYKQETQTEVDITQEAKDIVQCNFSRSVFKQKISYAFN
jgi:hypothetical protein